MLLYEKVTEQEQQAEAAKQGLRTPAFMSLSRTLT
jgi:hypothetical protein